MNDMKHTYDTFFGPEDFPCYEENPPAWANFEPSTILEILRNEAIPASNRIHAFIHKAAGIDDRTLRLFACGCARDMPLGDDHAAWDTLLADRNRKSVEVSERFADGAAGIDELMAATGDWDKAWQARAAARTSRAEAQVQFAIELLKNGNEPGETQ
jgi:hypothetical protein